MAHSSTPHPQRSLDNFLFSSPIQPPASDTQRRPPHVQDAAPGQTEGDVFSTEYTTDQPLLDSNTSLPVTPGLRQTTGVDRHDQDPDTEGAHHRHKRVRLSTKEVDGIAVKYRLQPEHQQSLKEFNQVCAIHDTIVATVPHEWNSLINIRCW